MSEIFEAEILYLRERVRESGIILSPVQAEHLRIYLSELLDWGRKINLIGLASPKRIIAELFFDSLIPTPFLPRRGKMLDIGSGAGIPGLPIKIMLPDLEAHLLEPNRKKTSFLKHIVRLLNLEKITIIQGRVEQDGYRSMARSYDLVTARALTGPSTVIDWCAPFLKPEGLAILFLGGHINRSIRQAREQLEMNNLTIKRQIDYHLPENQKKRTIIILQKKT